MASTDIVEVRSLAREIAQKFDVFECLNCVLEIKGALKSEGYHGQLIEIRANEGDFIISETYGEHRSISQSGRHFGVCIEGVVFDNIHKNGIPYDQWLSDFDAIGGVHVHEVTDF